MAKRKSFWFFIVALFMFVLSFVTSSEKLEIEMTCGMFAVLCTGYILEEIEKIKPINNGKH
jgi:FtsH-binding integral membrane protein